MKITIAYLYYDLLNLYGENGNIKILKHQLENLGIDVNLKFLTIDDPLNFEDYDLVYMGSGTEKNQLLALKDLLKYKNEIKQSIENNKMFLITGNSLELFGKHIMKEKKVKCLNVFKFETKHEIFRMADEALFINELFDEPFIGFQNQIGIIKNNPNPAFKVLKGIGSYPNSTNEGIFYKSFYGTYLIGPILIRNPHFLKYIIKKLIKGSKIKLTNLDLKLEEEAYNDFIENFHQGLLSVKG